MMSRNTVLPFRRAVGFLLLAFFLSLVATLARPAFGADATVNWTHPTQREDNSALPLTEIRETQIDWAKCTAGSAFPTTADGTKAVTAPATTTTITALGYGTWCFRARTVDTLGNASANSAVVWKQNVAPPKPPTITTVGGLVWEMRFHPVDGPYLARVIGTVDAGKPCAGLAPQIGFDLFSIDPKQAHLDKRPNRNSTVVAQCDLAT